MKTKIFPLLLFTFISFITSAQTLVNRAWVDTTGHPNININFQAFVKDASYLVTAGTSYHAGQSDSFYVSKISLAGVPQWQFTYIAQSHNSCVAVDAYISGSYVYVTGLVWDSADMSSRFLTLKINYSNGSVVWNKLYAGAAVGYAAASSIQVDASDNVYIAGSEQVSSTDYKLTVIKYNSSGTQQWVAHYDSVGYYDAATAMLKTSGRVEVTGFSGTAFSSWDFVTCQFNDTTGALISTSRSSNGNGNFSQPIGMVQDYNNNTLVCGTATKSGTKTDIKLIKYNSSSSEVWVRTWGNADSLPDEAASIERDVLSHSVIVGTTTKSNGGKDIVTLRYDKNGNLLWSRTISAPNPTDKAEARRVTVDAAMNIYVTGKVFNGTDNDFVTFSYDPSGNLRWYKSYDGGNGSNESGFNILTDASSNVYVSGKSSKDTVTRFVTIKYEQLDLSSAIQTDTSGNPLYIKNQILVKFNKNAVKVDAVNNEKLNFGNLDAFLTDSAIRELDTLLPRLERYCKLARIYTGLKTTDTISISRLGERIPIPDFWSTFVLVYSSSLTEKQFCDTLNQLFPFIETAELDILGTLASAATDPLYMQQYNLHPPMVYPTSDYPNAGSDIEGAWEYTTGKPYIKVGVFDDGISGAQKDFLLDSNDINSTIVKSGRAFNGTIWAGIPLQTEGTHGTECAGIIAARRNNGMGIAGVAGGEGSDSTTGCTLYSYFIMNASNAVPIHTFQNDLVYASTQTPDSSYGDGMHVINHSYGFGGQFQESNNNYYADTARVSWRAAFKYSFRNKVVNCFSSGNFGGESLLPPKNMTDDWAFVVSGTGINGNFHDQIEAQESIPFVPDHGFGVDIAALSSGGVIPTTWNNKLYPEWGGFFADAGGGTSFAAPLVTGVSGLLFSYLNDSLPSYKNLSPEDVEYILQRSAFNIDTPGYDLLTGYGRLNAGGALSIINTAKRKLKHIDSDSIPTCAYDIQKVDSNRLFKLYDMEKNIAGQLFQRLLYKVDVYKVSCVIPHNIITTDTIVGVWGRSGSSYVYESPSFWDSDSVIMPVEHVYLGNVDNQSATLWGYTYQLKNATTNVTIGWLPMDTAQAKTTNFAYSVLLGDSIQSPWDSIISSATTVAETNYNIRLYPNPTGNMQLLEVELEKPTSQISIKLYDAIGDLVKDIFNGKLDVGSSKFYVDLKDVQGGIYIYSFQDSENGKRKFIKTIKL